MARLNIYWKIWEIFFERASFARSPEQYNDEFNAEKENRELSDFDGSIVVCGDALVWNQQSIDLILQKEDIEISMLVICLFIIIIFWASKKK